MLFFCHQCRVNLILQLTLNVFPCANDDIIKPNLYKMAVTPEYTGSSRTNRGLPRSALTPSSSHYVMISCLLDGKLLFRGTFSPERRTICWMFLEKQEQFERFVALLQVSFDTELSPCSPALHLPRHQGLRHPLPCLA